MYNLILCVQTKFHNNSVIFSLRLPSNYCQDLGFFQAGNQSGQPFSDPCKQGIDIEEIQVTLGPTVSSDKTIFKSLRTNYR